MNNSLPPNHWLTGHLPLPVIWCILALTAGCPPVNLLMSLALAVPTRTPRGMAVRAVAVWAVAVWAVTVWVMAVTTKGSRDAAATATTATLQSTVVGLGILEAATQLRLYDVIFCLLVSLMW